MLSASLYIIWCSARNRLLVRLRRLREPRYMFGAIAGAAYFYFAVFARLRAGRNRPRPTTALPNILLSTYGSIASVGGAGLLVVALLAWIFPGDSALLTLSEADTNLLVPAPVTRRQLVFYRLLRSQLPLMFGAIVSSVFIPLSGTARLRFGVAMFLFFITIRLYYTGVTLARGRLASPDSTERRAAWTPLLLLFAAAAAIAGSALRVFQSSPNRSVLDVYRNVGRALDSGTAALLVAPFAAVVRPLLARSASELLVGEAGALVVILVLLVWVLHADELFQARADGGPLPAQRAQSARVPRVGRISWTLALSGRTEQLFFWKSSLQSLRRTNLMSVLPFVIPATVFAVLGSTAKMSEAAAPGPAAALTMASLVVAGFSTLLGPQIVRTDLRTDLRYLDVLKTWPVKPSAVIRGQLLWPTVSLTLCAWCAVIAAAVFSTAAFPRMTGILRWSTAAAALLLVPACVAAQLIVHNAAAILFPAWVSLGSQRPRGVDAMGQRLILFGGVLLALVVMLGPGAIAGGIVGFAFYRLIGPPAFVPAAAVCLAAVSIEIALVTEMLAGPYDRVDLSQVERPD
jgi:hypothetical protein